MAVQPFEQLLEGDPPLLHQVEALVVDAHRRGYAASGRTDWSEPKAYHWLHYEDQDPVARLAEGARLLPPDYDETSLATAERLAIELGRSSERKPPGA